jgi:hypothetical protein
LKRIEKENTMIRRYSILVAALAIGLGGVLLSDRAALTAGDASADESRTPTVKFSHRFHITEAGVTDCATCHPAAASSKSVSDNLAATHDACVTCHEQQVTDAEQLQCGYCHKNTSDFQAAPSVKRDLIFSHEAHTAMAGVECATCHAGVDMVENVTAANFPSMATCNTCHNDVKASNTCESCHTNFVTLLPVDHERSDFARNHRDMTRLGALQTDCQTCHKETFCQQCHFEPDVKSYSYGRRRDLTTEPAHKTSTKDSPRQTLLQNVHELNYRFTHGIDAKSKLADCQSCHSVQTFCAECHSAGGNITQLRFKPSSHSLPGFTTLGRGSGGGLHAEEARRDMETCIGCHDVEGKDPTCLTCHLDNGRVR